MAFKRRRVHAPRKSFAKRRRVLKRRSKRGRRRSFTEVNSRQLSSRTVPQRRKKLLPKRVYRSKLWNLTFAMQKYRSTFIIANPSISTPNNATQHNLLTVSAIYPGASPFWTAAGGSQSVNFTSTIGPPPVYTGTAPSLNPNSIIIRGGKMFINLSPDTTDANQIRLRVQLAWPKQQTINAANTTVANTTNTTAQWLTAVGGSYPVAYTTVLQDYPDYYEYYYHPVLDREMILAGGQSMQLEYKIKPTKIDCDAFLRDSGYAPIWFVYLSQNNNNIGGAEVLSSQVGYELSFCVVDL